LPGEYLREEDMTRNLYQKLKTEIITITPSGIIKFFASPYVAGYSLQSAVDCADDLLKNRGLFSTVDVLGESACTPDGAVRFKDLYIRTIKALSDNFPDKSKVPSISLKPSSMVCAVERGKNLEICNDTCESHIEEIARTAKSCGVDVTIDMEDHHWTEVTLAMHQSLRAKGLDNVGTVLQSMLYRTPDDIKNLPENSRIRICTGGVYAESPSIAHQTKESMKECLVEQTKQLFEKGAYVEIATHDEHLIEKIFRSYIIPQNIPSERFEIQMLMGVPREKMFKEMQNGKYLDYREKVKVRLYVPFAEDEVDAIKYSKRRLLANPEILRYGITTFINSSGH
jgi:proline dehydrogenase